MNARWVSRCDVMLPGRYGTDSGNVAVARHSYSPVEVHASECVAYDQHRYFQANSLKTYIGMGLFSLGTRGGCRDALIAPWAVLYGLRTPGVCEEIALASESLGHLNRVWGAQQRPIACIHLIE
jgi:hypothetical protein